MHGKWICKPVLKNISKRVGATWSWHRLTLYQLPSRNRMQNSLPRRDSASFLEIHWAYSDVWSRSKCPDPCLYLGCWGWRRWIQKISKGPGKGAKVGNHDATRHGSASQDAGWSLPRGLMRQALSAPLIAFWCSPGFARTGPRILIPWIAKLADHQCKNRTRALNAAGAPAIIAQLKSGPGMAPAWFWDVLSSSMIHSDELENCFRVYWKDLLGVIG